MNTITNLRNKLFPVAQKHLEIVRATDPLRLSIQFQGGWAPIYLKRPLGHLDDDAVLHVVATYGTNYAQNKKTQEPYTWYREAPEIIEEPYADDQLRPALEHAMKCLARNQDAWVRMDKASPLAAQFETYITVIWNRCPFVTLDDWTEIAARERDTLLSYSSHLKDFSEVLVESVDLWVGHGATAGWSLFKQLRETFSGQVPWLETFNLSRRGLNRMKRAGTELYHDLYRLDC